MKLDLEGESATTTPRKLKNGAISLSLNFDDIFPGKTKPRSQFNRIRVGCGIECFHWIQFYNQEEGSPESWRVLLLCQLRRWSIYLKNIKNNFWIRSFISNWQEFSGEHLTHSSGHARKRAVKWTKVQIWFQYKQQNCLSKETSSDVPNKSPAVSDVCTFNEVSGHPKPFTRTRLLFV
ncbi:Uncharacterized protein Adt_06592 [Abeliophyllum distichum]|uniref:Uncharacterized protein n=1 Tax=Abeliophyllum distichum TaxID=126358 RepID=A0ABD1V7V1_9LAMI